MAKTLTEIEQIEREYLLAEDVAAVLSMTPNYIRHQAQNDPDKLGFPVVVAGTRVRIPKEGFLYFCRFGRPVQVIE